MLWCDPSIILMAQVFHPTTPHSDRELVSGREIDVGLRRLTRRRLEWLAMGFLVFIALVMWVYQVGVFPDTVLADEADNEWSASILEKAKDRANTMNVAVARRSSG